MPWWALFVGNKVAFNNISQGNKKWGLDAQPQWAAEQKNTWGQSKPNGICTSQTSHKFVLGLEGRPQEQSPDTSQCRHIWSFLGGPSTGPGTGVIYAYVHHQRNALKFPRFRFLAVLGNRRWVQCIFSTSLSLCFDFCPFVIALSLTRLPEQGGARKKNACL